MRFPNIFTRKTQQKTLDLTLLPYAREFDPVRHKNKILAISQYEDNCIPFKVSRVSNKGGRWPLTEFDHFPLEEEVMAAVYEDYGGGKYDVFAGTTLLKSYQFPGEAKGRLFAEGLTKGKGRGFKSNIEEKAAEAFDDLLEANPKLREGLMWGILQKHFGVGMPQEADPLDEVLDAEIQSNPEYKKAAIEARLKAMGAQMGKEDDRDDIEKGIELLQKLQTLREAAGLDPSNNPWWQDVLKEIAKNFNLGSLGQMSSTETQQPQIPAKPPTIPQPRGPSGVSRDQNPGLRGLSKLPLPGEARDKSL
jgi:hypothetical protein